ncbi:MAG: TonB-dependent receptor [Geobacter sp.]|nr:TonB-dependent receptor [Geobacter sp.]
MTAVFSHPALAATEGSYELGEIVVSGTGAGVEASQTVHEVTAEDIKARNARTLDEALNLLPGVSIRTAGEGVPRIDIRGFKTRHVLLLLDGIPINYAFDQQFDPSIIPTENIASIKLTTGPSSVLYGQGGLGGVINIITKKGQKGVSGMLAGETGDHRPWLGKASVSGGSEKADFFVSGSAYKRDNYPLSHDFAQTSEQRGDYRNNSDKERNSLFANAGFAPTKDLTLGLTFSYNEGEYGIPSTIVKAPGDTFIAKPKYQRVDDFQGYAAQLAANYDIPGPLEMRSWVFFNQLDEQKSQYDNANFNTLNLKDAFRQNSTSTNYGYALQSKYDLGRAGGVTLGFNYERDRWESDGFIKPTNTTTRSLADTKAFNVYSVELEYEFSPLDNLGVTAGYGHHWQDRLERDDNDFSVQTGVHYDLTTGTRLKAAFQRNIRFPSISQLYDTAPAGNPNLKPERAYHYQAGVEQKLPLNSRMSITGFRTDAYDFIEKDSSNVNQNFSKYRFHGMEIEAETRFVERLLLRAAYSFLISEDRTATEGKEELQYRPKDKATLEGRYDFACGFTPYASVQYVANQYYYSKSGAVVKARLNDYVLVNLKLNQKLMDGKLNLYIGADNLFDKNYEQSYALPQSGRFIYGGVEFRI